MHISVTFKNMDSSDYLKSFIQEKLDRIDKLLDHPGNADIVLKVENQRRIAEISLSSDRMSIHASDENEEMHAAIDLAVDKLKKQITKAKEKLQNRRMRSRGASEKASAMAE